MGELTFDVGLAAKLKQAVIRNDIPDLADIDWLCEGSNLADVRRLRQGHVVLTAPADAIIRLDRTSRPAYPDWADQDYINNPQFITLEQTGPSEYGLGTLDQWLHDDQNNGKWVKGTVINDHLTSSSMLEDCVGFADLLEIQKLDIKVFRKHFKNRTVYGWKSVVRRHDGYLLVPCLFEYDGTIRLRWSWLGDGWHDSNPALRFAKN